MRCILITERSLLLIELVRRSYYLASSNVTRSINSSDFLLLGYFHFSVSWILLAVFIYLFRQHQRTKSKLRHRMLTEINDNEEQYIKARLDELPSWVMNSSLQLIMTDFSSRFVGIFPGC